MNFRQWTIFKSLVCLVVGVLFVLVPQLLLVMWGVVPGGEPVGMYFMARLYGAMFISMGLVLWFAGELKDDDARRVLALPVVVGDALGFVIALNGQVAGTMNALGWLVVGVYLLLTLGFGYYAFAHRAMPPKPA
jgi:hypothetical protein